MKHHTIELQDLQEWKEGKEVLFVSSTREKKRLVATLNGGFKVIVDNVVIYECIQPYLAVDKYNSITEKYIDKLKDFKL